MVNEGQEIEKPSTSKQWKHLKNVSLLCGPLEQEQK